MLQAGADVLIASRKRMADRLQDLTPEQWFTQPDGFANNVAWNVGHLALAQQYLCYGLAEVPFAMPKEQMETMNPLYGGGTSPADWSGNPDTDELLHWLVEMPQKLAADIAAGKFDNFVPPEPTEGRFLQPNSTMHIMLFNHYHEGLHAGTIGELLGYMKAK